MVPYELVLKALSKGGGLRSKTIEVTPVLDGERRPSHGATVFNATPNETPNVSTVIVAGTDSGSHILGAFGIGDADISAILPDLGRLFAVPPPTEHVIACREVAWDKDVVRDNADHPIRGALPHAVTVSRPRQQASRVVCVPWAWRGEGKATRRGACGTRRRARASFRVVQPSLAVPDARDGVTRPGRAFGFDSVSIHEDSLRTHGVFQSAIVPLQDLLCAVKLERMSLEAFFGEWL